VDPFILAFVCLECRLVVELDGSQHRASRESDLARTRWLEHHGFKVIRFNNSEVWEALDDVLMVIREEINGRCESMSYLESAGAELGVCACVEPPSRPSPWKGEGDSPP
jgi:very-short-patch-repair endonuclease